MGDKEPEPPPSNDDAGPASDYVLTAISDDEHFRFRRCSNCGDGKMAPTSRFAGGTMNIGTDQGLIYHCPACDTEVEIRDSGALVMGGVASLFWGAAGVWMIYEGPVWYIDVLNYGFEFEFDGYTVLDTLVALGCTAIAGFAAWAVFKFLLGPLMTVIRHPVTGENRELSVEDAREGQGSRRVTLLSFFVYPLAVWVFVLGALWVMDAAGIDVRDNEFVVFGVFAVAFFILAKGARIHGAKLWYVFAGLAIWLAVFVAFIFLFQPVAEAILGALGF